MKLETKQFINLADSTSNFALSSNKIDDKGSIKNKSFRSKTPVLNRDKVYLRIKQFINRKPEKRIDVDIVL